MTALEEKAVPDIFGQLAEHYDQYAVLQREIGLRLLERLDFRRYEPGVILDLGCATGIASRSLVGQFPEARVLALDCSPAMLARANPGGEGGLSGLCADMHTLPLAPDSVDLVFSNLAISWGRDVQAIFTGLRRVMKPGAILVFTCFGPDTLFELKRACKKAGGHSTIPDFPDMHDVGDELVRAGFREPVMDVDRLTLEYPDLAALLIEMEATGITAIGGENWCETLDTSRAGQLSEIYARPQGNDRFPAVFEIIYGTTFAPEEGQPVKTPEGDVATFSVDSLRVKSTRKA
jgi:malonyl-CoA O-methyltransferase